MRLSKERIRKVKNSSIKVFRDRLEMVDFGNADGFITVLEIGNRLVIKPGAEEDGIYKPYKHVFRVCQGVCEDEEMVALVKKYYYVREVRFIELEGAFYQMDDPLENN